MSEEIPILSAREVIKALSKLGFRTTRQRGSHIVLAKVTADGKVATVVPKHREIARGTLDGILTQARISRGEFLKALEK